MNPAADESSDSLISQLRGDWGLNHLLQALALGEGFELHILICDNPRIAAAVLAILEENAPGRAVRLKNFQKILEVLSVPPEWAEGDPPIIVIDASYAPEKDEPAWRELFRRMNERRNDLARRLRVPLVLLLTPPLEVAFAHEAPDFWSIRSTAGTIAPVRLPSGPVPVREGEPPTRQEQGYGFIAEPDRLKVAVDEARRRVEESSDDLSALAALAVQLLRLGRYEEERGTLVGAGAAYEEAFKFRRRLVELEPDREDCIADLTESLVAIGDVQSARGSLEAALSSYEESLELMRRLLSRDPDRPEWLRDLVVSLSRVASIQGEENKEPAVALLDEALAVANRLRERYPQLKANNEELVEYLEDQITRLKGENSPDS